eukprot:CAMPEP_0201244712 /NCGR_PEP_ID=MMETSP0852-20130820/45602_1 /ASSEMBLY_ACC=CAM_ASM_000632 /TAXON_ID=183588 /ORGANISM="Pseudo-nitzschia fraudulenta, Strain WWA7" /LENGTH=111 /DNA_ID=CAMNT_0047542257 /DNA_START=332 /DNA_END=667 /DNA_ORIENTATION=-
MTDEPSSSWFSTPLSSVPFVLTEKRKYTIPSNVSNDSTGANKLYGVSSFLSLEATTSSGCRRQYAATSPGVTNPATDAAMLRTACIDPWYFRSAGLVLTATVNMLRVGAAR